jgi:hypothetical protein
MNTSFNYHSYQKFSNSVQEWDHFDSKERFEKNTKDNFELLNKNNWFNKTISYKFNSNGFRSDEFDSSSDSILFLGCSLTFGTGLCIEDTYNYLIAKSLNLKFFNLGLGGSSNDTAFRLGYHYIPLLKPKVVVLASPEITRLELCNNGEIFYYRPQLTNYQMDRFYKKWISDDTNSLLNCQKNSLAIEGLCLKLGIKFHYFNAPDLFLHKDIVHEDYARDLIHPGVKTHHSVYKKIMLTI